MAKKLTEKSIVLATHNQGKVQEFSEMFKPYDVEVLCAGDLGLEDPEETGTTFAENALLKARVASQATGKPAMADDSGLCVTALEGAPGIFSARWAENEKGARDFDMAMEKVYRGIEIADDKSAAFVAVLALVWPDGSEAVFEGRVDGDIVWPPRGDQGFGYDPIFQARGKKLTFAEDPTQKKELSHRHIAFQKLVDECL